MSNKTRLVLVIALLVIGISGCDRLLSILSDDRIPETDGRVP